MPRPLLIYNKSDYLIRFLYKLTYLITNSADPDQLNQHSLQRQGYPAVDDYLGDQEEGLYFKAISKLEQRWKKFIGAKGDYIVK